MRISLAANAGIAALTLLMVAADHSRAAEPKPRIPDQVRMSLDDKRPMNMAISPDGKLAAVNVSTGEIYICNAQTGELRFVLRGHSQWVWLNFSPDSKRLASGGSQDGQVRLWDVTTGKELALLIDVDTQVSMVRFSPDGTKLVSSEFVLRDTDRDGTIRIWDVEKHAQTATLTADNGLTDITFSPDGRLLASSEYRKKTIDAGPLSEVKVWDLNSETIIRRIPNRCGTMSRIRFSPDGKTLAIAGYNAPHVLQASHRVELFDTRSWKRRGVLLGHTRRIFGMVFTPDGRSMVTSGSDGTLRVWDLETFRLKTLVETNSGNTCQLTLSSDGKRFALVSKTGGTGKSKSSIAEVVRVGALRNNADYARKTMFIKTLEVIHALQFSRDGKNLAASRRRKLHYWDATTETDLPPLAFSRLTLRTFSPDLRYAVSAYRTIDILDVTTGKVVHRFLSTSQGTYQPVYSPDGRFLAAAAPDGSVKIWDMKSARLWAAASKQKERHPYLAFTPDQQRLISAAYYRRSGDIVVWDLPSRETPLRKPLPDGSSSDKPSKPTGTPKVSPEVTGALKQAYRLISSGKSSATSLQKVLVPVIAQLPQVVPNVGRNKPKWYRITVNRDGSRLAVVRFKSTLKKKADLEWVFHAPGMSNWYILPVRGTMKGFRSFSTERGLQLAGASWPEDAGIIFQQLSGSKIEPGQEYLLWFRFRSDKPVTLQFCLHLSEAGQHKDLNNSIDIAKAIGLKTPLQYQTATNIPLKRHQELHHGSYVTQVAVSPDGKLLASVGSGKIVKLWDLTTGKLRRSLSGSRVAFSPDGRTIATASTTKQPRTILLFDMKTGKLLQQLRGGHVRAVLHMQFSPDGTRLATGDAAGVVALWNVTTGRQDWSAFEFK